MKIKFIGLTEAEDKVVEIPDGSQEVVEVHQAETKNDDHNSPWFGLVIFTMLCVTVIVTSWIWAR